MNARKLIVFKHATALGSAPSHVLFDCVKVEPKDPSKPARSFSDFDLKIDRAGIPQGVELIELL
jgi:CRISPR-associated protein Csd2